MRNLIGHFDPSVWMVSSAVVFFAVFVVLTVWVYLPSRRGYYDKNAKLPLHEGKPNE